MSAWFHKENLNVSSQILHFLGASNVRTKSRVVLIQSSTFELKAYSVGQGMCSLFTDGNHGILFDVGAGVPVIRQNYQLNKIHNDLRTDVKSLNTLQVVLSHLDSDHYRILFWDTFLLDKVSKIYIPYDKKYNTNWFTAKDKVLKGKVIETKSILISTTNFEISVFLTNMPKPMTKNDNELIAHFVKDKKVNILYPGDYSYESLSNDKDPNIKRLSSLNYEFILVPHHGDRKSRLNVPNRQSNQSQVFFSAGTHKGYRHPKISSLLAHRRNGFKCIGNKTSPDIKCIAKY